MLNSDMLNSNIVEIIKDLRQKHHLNILNAKCYDFLHAILICQKMEGQIQFQVIENIGSLFSFKINANLKNDNKSKKSKDQLVSHHDIDLNEQDEID